MTTMAPRLTPFPLSPGLASFLRRIKRALRGKKERSVVALAETGGERTHVFSKAGGLGDELMAAMAIQATAAIHPSARLVFHTRFQSLFEGLLGASAVRPLQHPLPANAVGLTYAAKQPLSVPAQMAAQLGVTADAFPIQLPERPLHLPGGWPDSEARVVLVQTTASGWTPNKQWPAEYWLQLINRLPAEWKVVEVGTESALEQAPDHPGWRSLVGRTDLEEYISCFRRANGFVGPVSSGMHLAHAYKLPSVIIVGGYEAAHFPYPLARQLGSDLPCAPCWLRTPCPYDRRCLREITPEQVLAELLTQVGKKQTTDY